MINTVLNPSGWIRHPFAILHPSNTDGFVDLPILDGLALILPSEALPKRNGGDFISVRMDRGVVYWQGVDGLIHAISQWHEGEPSIDPLLHVALTREEGVLVLFMNPAEAKPQHWMVFKCHQMG